jgi:hypothetical protein
MNSLFPYGIRRSLPWPLSILIAAALLSSLAISACTVHDKGRAPQSAWIAGWMAAPSWRPQNPRVNEMTAFSNQSVRQDVWRDSHFTVWSLGTGVATALAVTREVENVILVTPYDSIVSVAAERYPWAPVRWLIKDDYNSVKRI